MAGRAIAGPGVAYLSLAGTALTLGIWLVLPASAGPALLVASTGAAVVALVVGIRRYSPRPTGRLVLLGAQACSCVAFVLMYVIPRVTGADLAVPSSVDVFLLVAHAGNVAAVLVLSRNRSGVHRHTSVPDVLIVTTGLALLSWFFLIRPQAEDSALGLGPKFLSVASPALDLFLLLLVLRLVRDHRKLTPAAVLLPAWAALQLAGDTSYTVLALAGHEARTSSVVLLWIAASGCLVAVVLHPATPSLGKSAPAPQRPTSRARPVIVFATVLVLPVLLLVRVVQQDFDDLPVITGAALLVSFLVLVRGTVVRDRRSTRPDRAALLRLVAGFAGGVILPLALMAESSIQLSERLVINDTKDRVSTTSLVSAQLVQKQMEGLAQLVGAYAERRLLAGSLGDGTTETFDKVAVQRHLRQLQAADTSLTGVFVVDAGGRVGDVYPRTPVIVGQDFGDRDWYHGALRTGRPYISEAFTTSISGEARVVAAASPVRRPSDSRILGVLVAVYDLRAIQAFSEDLARAQGVELRITDQRGTVVAAPGADGGSLVDAAGEEGVARALRGSDSLDTTEDDVGEEILSAYAPVHGLGWTVTVQVPTATAYASLRQLRATVLAVAVLLGQVLVGGLVLMARAQRQRQEAQRDLEERERGTSAILEAAADAYVSIDQDGLVVSWSRQAELLFGWSATEACGSLLAELIVPPAMREQHTVGLRRLVTTGQSTILGLRIEVSAVHRDGHEFPIELATWRSEIGGEQIFNAFIHDISDRKQHEAELSEARDEALETSRVKTEFLAVMSHELRTPMNGIMGMTSLLLGTELSPRQREYAETVRSSADNLLELLNDILDLSKVEANRLELEDLDFDLPQVVRDVVHLLQINADQKGIALTGTIDDDVPVALRGDPGRLRQVLMNLVGNAVKFTAEGSVCLRVHTAGPSDGDGDGDVDRVRLRFEIIDTGIGIAPEAVARVFQPFSQADASTTRQYGGTGLGLAISQRLVAMFGGEIGAESELGAGSTFWFTAGFLAGRPLPPVRPETTPAAAVPAAAPGLILVVDDNATNQKIAVRMLEGLGHRADVAADGAEAVSAWASVPYGLVLMDCRMPVMDGYEATRAIRAAEGAGRRTPIVAMTASAMVDDRERCLNAGMDDFLSKPVQMAELRDTVNHWLNRSAESAGASPALPNHAPEPAVAEGPPVLDEDIIAELSSFGRDFIVSLVEEFRAGVPAMVARIRTAVDEGDAPELARSAHALRGSAANMGGARVAGVCARLEEAGVGDRPAEAVPLVPVLELEAAHLLTAVSAVIDVAV